MNQITLMPLEPCESRTTRNPPIPIGWYAIAWSNELRRGEVRHLRGDLCGSILFDDLETVSIHELLVDRLDLPLTRVWQRITAETLDAQTAAVLEVPVGCPAFHILRTTYTHDTPVTFVEYFIRGELAFEDTFAPGCAGPPPGLGFGH